MQCKIYLSRPGIIDARARYRAAARRLRNTVLNDLKLLDMKTRMWQRWARVTPIKMTINLNYI
jgi:hypothetical protein